MQVTPVTMVPCDAGAGSNRLIAVNMDFIAYGLKPGHIRVIHRSTGGRALLKGHTGLITSLRFNCSDSSVLASGGPDGKLIVWRLAADAQGTVSVDRVHAGTRGLAPGVVSVAWLSRDRVIAWSRGTRKVTLGYAGHSAPFHIYSLRRRSEDVRDLVLSSAALSLAPGRDDTECLLGLEDGSVYFWSMDHGPEQVNSAARVWLAEAPVSGLEWLPAARGGRPGTTAPPVAAAVLGGGAEVRLLTFDPRAPLHSGAPLGPRLSLDPGSAPYHLVAVRGADLLLLAGSRELVALRLGPAPGTGAGPRIVAGARFGLSQPVLSADALALDGPPRVEVAAVQRTAVQQYTLDLDLLRLPEAAAGGRPEVPAGTAPAAGATATQDAPRPRSSAGSLPADSPSPASSGPASMQASATGTSSASGVGVGGSIGVEGAEEEEEEGEITSECPSPPSSPVGGQAVQVPVPILLPAGADATASFADAAASIADATASSAGPDAREPPADSQQPRPPPGLPSRRMLAPEEGLLEVTSPPASAIPFPDAFLRRGRGAGARAGAAPAPAPQPAASDDSSVAQHPGAAPGAAPASATAAESLDGAVAAAVASALDGSHRKFVGHVTLMFRELVKSLRAEMAAAAATQHDDHQATLRLTLRELRDMVAAERAAALEEHRAQAEAAALASTSRIVQEVVRAQQAEFREHMRSVSASTTLAVQAAVATALPEALASSAALLAPQVASAVSASLAPALAGAFTSAFSTQLVPGFEAACGSMLSQLTAAMARGLDAQAAAAAETLAELRGAAAELTRAAGGLARAAPSPASNFGPAPPAPLDPARRRLLGLLEARLPEEAFDEALSAADAGLVGWLCAQEAAAAALATRPPRLGQPALLSLAQQLSSLLDRGDPTAPAGWAGAAVDGLCVWDARIAAHVEPVLRGVEAAVHRARRRGPGSPHAEAALGALLAAVRRKIDDAAAHGGPRA
uniref:Enhancer of mRNA-decapping protein 4 C-terminal domain-containing protein n=1 Tax=Auxenochlorella protothecoides TaxID=3075 RepID=A0A1D2A7N6_AUXPR